MKAGSSAAVSAVLTLVPLCSNKNAKEISPGAASPAQTTSSNNPARRNSRTASARPPSVKTKRGCACSTTLLSSPAESIEFTRTGITPSLTAARNATANSVQLLILISARSLFFNPSRIRPAATALTCRSNVS